MHVLLLFLFYTTPRRNSYVAAGRTKTTEHRESNTRKALSIFNLCNAPLIIPQLTKARLALSSAPRYSDETEPPRWNRRSSSVREEWKQCQPIATRPNLAHLRQTFAQRGGDAQVRPADSGLHMDSGRVERVGERANRGTQNGARNKIRAGVPKRLVRCEPHGAGWRQ